MPFSPQEASDCRRLLEWGLAEDLGSVGDITSQRVIDPGRHSQALLVPRRAGIVAGLDALPILADLFGDGLSFERLAEDGPVAMRQPLARCSGPTRSVLTTERTLLNFLCRLSGVATLTRRFVDAVAGTKAQICDTRKTTPGWRYLEKYAVRVGGGTNHRLGLFDAILIKDNHIADLARHEARPVYAAVVKARGLSPVGVTLEVEVDSLDQLADALDARPDIVLLDNMPLDRLRESVALRNARAPGVLLEASGGVDLTTVRAVAETGVDRISVGALTHSAPILDIGLDEPPA
jgi:nicotinate-nucleotide pyrophosphorylase (carboxylating)